MRRGMPPGGRPPARPLIGAGGDRPLPAGFQVNCAAGNDVAARAFDDVRHESKLVADTAPTELLGTTFGIFNLVSGVALLLASVIAGALWSTFGASATFLAGAVFAAVAAVGLLAVMRQPAFRIVGQR